MVTNPTPNLQLGRPNFNQATWHDEINGNFLILDEATGNVLARFALYASGLPAAGETLGRLIMTDEILFPAALVVSRAKASVASTGTAVFSVKKNDVEFGTVTFTASATGVFAAASATTLEAGDILSIHAPSPQDATMANVSITLAGVRQIPE